MYILVKFARKERQKERWLMCLRGGTSTLLVSDPFREAPPHAVPGQVDWCVFFSSFQRLKSSRMDSRLALQRWNDDDLGMFSFLNPVRLRLQVLYKAASAHTPQHLDRKDLDTCCESKLCQAATEQQETNGQRRESPSNCYLFKKNSIASYSYGSLTLSHLITSAIYFKHVIL